jgi:hypothetical protein
MFCVARDLVECAGQAFKIRCMLHSALREALRYVCVCVCVFWGGGAPIGLLGRGKGRAQLAELCVRVFRHDANRDMSV